MPKLEGDVRRVLFGVGIMGLRCMRVDEGMDCLLADVAWDEVVKTLVGADGGWVAGVEVD